LRWVSAARFPQTIVTALTTASRSCHSPASAGRPCTKIRASSANEIAFEPAARKAVTGVGAPA